MQKMPPNPEFMRAMQEKARSNVSVPHRNKKRYDRARANAQMRSRSW